MMTRVVRPVCVTLLTDYGLEDGFVAACRGVLLRAAPTVPVVDITHEIPPQDLRRGAAVLAQTVPWFPPAVHVAVVDPGVGTRRRAVAVDTPRGALIGPDNGLLSWAWGALGGATSAVELAVPRGASATFHGRDVFAPAAGRLVTGAAVRDLGVPLDVASLVDLPEPRAWVAEGAIGSEIVVVDRFGNVQLAATAAQLAEVGIGLGDRIILEFRGKRVGARLGRTFGDVGPGELVLFEDSAGRMALAANGRDAARMLEVRGNETVLVAPLR